MRYWTIFLLGILIGCQGSDSDDEPATGNVMEIEPSQKELDEIAIVEQPQIIQDFFAVDESAFGAEYCYDYATISQLILYGENKDDNWTNFDVKDNYMTLYHIDCDVFLEFMTFELNGEKRAYLSQISNSHQQFNYLKWNTSKESWRYATDFPSPLLTEYFTDLSAQEVDIVNDYGADFVLLNPISGCATYIFSETDMRLNMGEKEMLEFQHEVAYEFKVCIGEDGLKMNRIETNIAVDELFFVAYSPDADPTAEFKQKYAEICAAFEPKGLNHQLIQYGKDGNFNIYFPRDTFDFSAMEQFEPRNGFWFYTYGDAPIDLDAENETAEIIRKAEAYFQEN